jgi:hypothetical protein
MRSKESDPKKALRLLKEDLINGPRHCFGNHNLCSTDFCTSAREQASSVVHTEMATEEEEAEDVTEAEGDDHLEGTSSVLHKR